VLILTRSAFLVYYLIFYLMIPYKINTFLNETDQFSTGSGPVATKGFLEVFLRFIRILGVVMPALGAAYRPGAADPPKPQREMRAAWVAAVSNIDWPSTNNLTSAQQKAELVAIMERAVQLKLNVIILQVRPGCDALYASKLEPWSEYLTGTMGKAPEPFYDPLELAVEEAHKRGLELDAWFNPYRARHAAAKSPICASHISRTQPQLVRQYGKSLWLDPGEPRVQDYSVSVILDVVRRYDIDGVHIDDYFYPYREKDASGKELDFPDDASWKRYGTRSGLSRNDWRRENVNVFVHRLYDSIKREKPWVKFGISPFGIWRPDFPAGVQGFDAYEKLFADSRKWLANGWLDYFAPQLYWSIQAKEQSFSALLKWWAEQNRQGRLLVPGLASTKASRPWPVQEIIEQVRLTRQGPGVAGQIHWNMSALMRNTALDQALERQVYAEQALVPACPWLRRSSPAKPVLSATPKGNAIYVDWKPGGTEAVSTWLLQTRSHGTWSCELLPRSRLSTHLGASAPEVIAVSAVDRYGNQSRPAVLRLN
jgi:uncharacterized lipoprotein YddW (UPF0748 family)